MNWKPWLYGLGATVIGGSATGMSGAIGASFAGHEVFSLDFWRIVGGCAIGGGLTSLVAYLKRSPLPNSGAAPPSGTPDAPSAQDAGQRPRERD